MKDKIVVGADNKEYYVLDELIYQERRYFLAFEVNDKEEKLSEVPNIFEVVTYDNKVCLKKLDEETSKNIFDLFAYRLSREEN